MNISPMHDDAGGKGFAIAGVRLNFHQGRRHIVSEHVLIHDVKALPRRLRLLLVVNESNLAIGRLANIGKFQSGIGLG